MADVNVFDYVTDRLLELRGDYGTLLQLHHDLRVKVAGIQTQVSVVYAILIIMLTGITGTFFHFMQQLAKFPTGGA